MVWLVLLFHTPLQPPYKVAKNWRGTNLLVTFDNGNANTCIPCHSELISAACRKGWSQGLSLRHLQIEWGGGQTGAEVIIPTRTILNRPRQTATMTLDEVTMGKGLQGHQGRDLSST